MKFNENKPNEIEVTKSNGNILIRSSTGSITLSPFDSRQLIMAINELNGMNNFRNTYDERGNKWAGK